MAKEDEDEHQSSLDSFTSEVVNAEDMFLEPPDLGQSMDKQEPLRSIEMPSRREPGESKPPPSDILYHDLGRLYPAAPIAPDGGFILHRGVLRDLTGVPQLMDWLSDGDIVIVEMGRMMQRELEFKTALSQLDEFVEGDLKGQIIQLTTSRLLLLPPGCRGVRGVEDEAFAAGPLE